jgi:hypothetical protein
MATIDFTNIAPSTPVTITLTSGDTISGLFVSVNSKGVNIKGLGPNAKVISRAISRVERVDVYNADTAPETPAELFTDEGTYGAADLAAALDMDAYDLRVALRAAGYWVGKGRKYAFDAGDANRAAAAVRKVLADAKAEADADNA